jgi:hypothetical protein
MGQTSSIYWRNPTLDDFQTIRVGGALGKVNGNSVQYGVIGQLVPAPGVDKVTYDGALTGEINNNPVTRNNATLYNIIAPDGTTYTAAHLVVAVNPAGVLCQGGDSGGPVFQRTPASGVNAVGTIVAFYGLESGGLACAAERIDEELAISNTHLLLGP